MVVFLQVNPNLKNNKCRKMQARLDNKMVKVSNEKYIEHPKFCLLSKFNVLKKHLTLMLQHHVILSCFFLFPGSVC